MASKGYGTTITNDTLRLVARYAPPRFTRNFLLQLKKTVDDHQHGPHTAVRKIRDWYGCSIKELLYNDFSDVALEVVQDAIEHAVYPRREVWRFLLNDFRSGGDVAAASMVQKLRNQARSRVVARTGVPPSPREFTEVASEDISDARSLRINVTEDDDLDAWRATISKLKSAFRSGTPVHAGCLAYLIQLLLFHGRASLVCRLRALAFSSGGPSTVNWATAEMIYRSQEQNDYISSLALFKHHFYMVGTPPEMYTPATDTTNATQMLPSLSQERGVSSLPLPSPLRHRYSAPRHVLYLLWYTAVQNAQQSSLGPLYRSFIESFAASRGIPTSIYPQLHFSSPHSSTASPSYAQPIPAASSFDHRFFGLFMKAFAGFGEHHSSRGVFLDMLRSGLSPTAEIEHVFAIRMALAPGNGFEPAMDYLKLTRDLVDKFLTMLDERSPAHGNADNLRDVANGFFLGVLIRRLLTDKRTGDAWHVLVRYGDVNQHFGRRIAQQIAQQAQHMAAWVGAHKGSRDTVSSGD
ncbi:uncharacterized protein BXZ73DRAFT_80765 [Epithele typhae]|uniref:uncharacterized protein n=1 Tax=Epithele typhae TaxID=378194 RepID=UPI002008CFEF|nr:uncharacterized protein BXZ73DRAFT_80765 [Epithele typhae]KAH9917637.1 hypothetical protein BXZ73DRAFT_80765 [Epithele typhae]